MSMYILTYTSVVNAGNFKAEWAKSFDHFDGVCFCSHFLLTFCSRFAHVLITESLISIDLTHDVSGVFNWSVKQCVPQAILCVACGV